MITDLNNFNNDNSSLTQLSDYSYENIFKVFQNNGYYSYNLLKKINFPQDLDQSYIDYVEINKKLSWTNLSYLEYGTILLWWLICATNNIQNPTQLPQPGTILKIIKPEYVPTILNAIKAQLNN